MSSPMDTQPTRRINWRHVTETAAPALAFLLVVVALLLNSYGGRRTLTDSLLAGCIRSTEDRVTNAHGWRTAEQARKATFAKTHLAPDRVAARRYDLDASSLEQRAGLGAPINPDTPLPTVLARSLQERHAFCQVRFPPPPLISVR